MADVNKKSDREKKKRKFSFKEKYDRKQKKKQKKEAEQLVTLTNELLATQEDEKNLKEKVSKYTISVALPGSILENAQSPELRTYLAGQIARALVIFNIDEVVIFNESTQKKSNDGLFKGVTKASDANVVFARILQYLECPQYLRKYFFPVHQDLKYAGLLNPLDCPHHMRMDDPSPYREGVTLNRPVKGGGSYVNAGMRKEVKVDKLIKPDVRVTVKLDPYDDEDVEKKKYLTGSVVSPTTPKESDNIYWGYSVRLANSFSAVFTESPYKSGYDLTMGTSERGEVLDQMDLPNFNHLLIVFGGLKGLELSLESDETLHESDVGLLFDHYINSCPDQGSRTIRTEEAVLITLSALRPKLPNVT
ncbi:putative methyltransferase C9orf114 [Clytia hemisphaerica]|uniref:28S rRNA (uridine-N(3))-methyltransferase n=1 Tax=Clytia hemisphaerica TaxID=252671 RepID=A0A7M5X5G2_9CNID